MALSSPSLAASNFAKQPNAEAPLEVWIDWFWNAFLPSWIKNAHHPKQIGFYDALDEAGNPNEPARRTVLAQARLLYTFSHLALLSDNPAYHEAASSAREAVRAFRKAPGLYCLARTSKGTPTKDPKDLRARSYDQSFVILGLSTWLKLHPEDEPNELEACWQALETHLTDPATGLLLEHDDVEHASSLSAPRRAQNPHMHNYEAALQAFEMTGNPVWLDRAAIMRAKGLVYFFDDASGTIREFVAPNLVQLSGRDGQYREIGHQYEWAWLLSREADFSGSTSIRAIAARLLSFADTHGIAPSGAMKGAAFDAVSSNLDWHEETFLLWPQTEAIKAHAIRARKSGHAQSAIDLASLVFRNFFAGQKVFANQIDANGTVIWNEALSRLLYHVVLSFTEGARAGLWSGPRRDQKNNTGSGGNTECHQQNPAV